MPNPNTNPNSDPKGKPAKRKEPSSGQIKQWLKSHGHDSASVDALGMSDKKKTKENVMKLHGA